MSARITSLHQACDCTHCRFCQGSCAKCNFLLFIRLCGREFSAFFKERIFVFLCLNEDDCGIGVLDESLRIFFCLSPAFLSYLFSCALRTCHVQRFYSDLFPSFVPFVYWSDSSIFYYSELLPIFAKVYQNTNFTVICCKRYVSDVFEFENCQFPSKKAKLWVPLKFFSMLIISDNYNTGTIPRGVS